MEIIFSSSSLFEFQIYREISAVENAMTGHQPQGNLSHLMTLIKQHSLKQTLGVVLMYPLLHGK